MKTALVVAVPKKLCLSVFVLAAVFASAPLALSETFFFTFTDNGVIATGYLDGAPASLTPAQQLYLGIPAGITLQLDAVGRRAR